MLAGDLLGIGQRTVERLRSAVEREPEIAGALLVDDEDCPQWLHAVWRLTALRAAIPPDSAGRSLKEVLGALPLRLVPAGPGEAADVDSPEDLPPGA